MNALAKEDGSAKRAMGPASEGEGDGEGEGAGTVELRAKAEIQKRVANYPKEVPAAKGDGKEAGLMSQEGAAKGGVKPEILAWFVRTQGPALVSLTLFLFALWRLFSLLADLLMSWWASRVKVVGQRLSEDEYLYWFAVMILLSS